MGLWVVGGIVLEKFGGTPEKSYLSAIEKKG